MERMDDRLNFLKISVPLFFNRCRPSIQRRIVRRNSTWCVVHWGRKHKRHEVSVFVSSQFCRYQWSSTRDKSAYKLENYCSLRNMHKNRRTHGGENHWRVEEDQNDDSVTDPHNVSNCENQVSYCHQCSRTAADRCQNQDKMLLAQVSDHIH